MTAVHIPVDINLGGALRAVQEHTGLSRLRAATWPELHTVCRALGVLLIPGPRTVTNAGGGR